MCHFSENRPFETLIFPSSNRNLTMSDTSLGENDRVSMKSLRVRSFSDNI